MSRNLTKIGDAAYAKSEKINAELLTLTYGALVAQLVKDYEATDEINEQLEKMGYNIGQRIIDEFLAKSGAPRCGNFKESVETCAKVGFRMFLGVAAQTQDWTEAETEVTLAMDSAPLCNFVELPEQYAGLHYANLLCGVVRGSLEMVGYKVECAFAKDALMGDEANEIRVSLIEVINEQPPADDD